MQSHNAVSTGRLAGKACTWRMTQAARAHRDSAVHLQRQWPRHQHSCTLRHSRVSASSSCACPATRLVQAHMLIPESYVLQSFWPAVHCCNQTHRREQAARVRHAGPECQRCGHCSVTTRCAPPRAPQYSICVADCTPHAAPARYRFPFAARPPLCQGSQKRGLSQGPWSGFCIVMSTL